MKLAMRSQGVEFTWEFDPTIHARHVFVDDEWDIILDRRLDIWQPYGAKRNDALSVETYLQDQRKIRQFEVIYRRQDDRGSMRNEGIDSGWHG